MIFTNSPCFQKQIIPEGSVLDNDYPPAGRANQIAFKKTTLQPSAMTPQEMNYFIEYYQEDSIGGRFLKGRKYARKQMNLLLLEKERRLG